jgi:hypothetical protein
MSTAAPVHSVILVHGGFVDGSGWQAVYNGRRRVGDTLIADPAPGAPVPPILPPKNGFLSSTAAISPWRSPPTCLPSRPRSWPTHRSLGATEDRMIPPQAQRAMAQRAGSTVTEVAASHSVFLSQPAVVADLIRQATAGSGSGRPLARVR